MTTPRIRNPGGRPALHGGRALSRLLRRNGLDKRTAVALEYHSVQDALAADRGGWENTTAGEKILIEAADAGRRDRSHAPQRQRQPAGSGAGRNEE